MKRLFLIVCFIISAIPLYANERLPELKNPGMLEDANPPAKQSFHEVWAYLMEGEESELQGTEPITDLCYFSAGMNYKGDFVGPKKIPANAKLPKNARVHLVIADLNNPDRVHFVIDPSFPLRKKFIDDVAIASKEYNGIQIDFESVHPDDKKSFGAFLRDLKKAIGSKTLSIALPARRTVVEDALNCKQIAKIVDRIFIMAYDQHWSGSQPGPIASPDWCEEVARFTRQSVPIEKLVMGIPFYGRSWQDKKTERAYRYSMIKDVLEKNGQNIRTGKGTCPNFEYDEKVKVTVYFENISSLMKKAALYRSIGVQGIGFWRIGQNPKDLWNFLLIDPQQVSEAK
jgi:spore germination protein